MGHGFSRVQALVNLNEPETAADLQQFLCAANWTRMSIPEFSSVVAPLSRILEEGYSVAGKRISSAINRVRLDKHGWGKDLLESFLNCKESLKNAVTLAHIVPNQIRCV